MGTIAEQTKAEELTDVLAIPTSKFISVSPHVKSKYSTSGIMWAVNISLAPAAILGAYYFGLRGIITLFLCIIASVASELFYQKLLNLKVTISDGSAFLTGLLLAMNLPPTVPFYLPLVGSVVAIILTKHLFGGLGFNLFNPALMARAFLMISFPKPLTTWIQPVQSFASSDSITSATPLGILKLEGYQQLINTFGDKSHMYWNLLIGNRGGSIGETAILALIAGGLFLLFTRIISWHTPLAFLGTAAIIAWTFGGKDALFTGDPLLHILSGGIVLGAFFMATDYVTSPMSSRGKLIFGAGCGLLTMLIRFKGGYPEGVMFAILIMNCFAPLIDKAFQPKIFGSVNRSAA
jgi:Na+-translocating ferredoxin:NAD+ oxidoreductase subunit D